jgi:hypothetical protein
LVIPGSWTDPRVYWERLRDPVHVEADGYTLLIASVITQNRP